MDTFFEILYQIDNYYWSSIGFLLIVLSGLYFSFKSRFFQFKVLGHLRLTVHELMQASKQKLPGLSPFRLYFASIGGMIGLGNIVSVVTAVCIGGPGALFWLWVAALSGMLIKYAEIYIGMRYRVSNGKGSYNGGPMYYIPHAFKGPLGKTLAAISAFLLCIYGVEIYQFTIITDNLTTYFSWNRELVILLLLAFTLYIGLGGVKRLANFCTWMMPLFIVLYVALCSWVIFQNIHAVPAAFWLVLKSAFAGHAPLGGFAGSTLLLAAKEGTARAVYSADIAIGFDSIIQSESRVIQPLQQARLAILSTTTDALICTLSMLLVLLTGQWTQGPGLPHSQYVAKILAAYVPHADSLMLVILFLAAFTTIQAYFVVGIKAASFLAPRWGKYAYIVYACFGFWFFAHYDQTRVSIIMTLSAGLLTLINLGCVLRLRKQISFRKL